MSAAANYEWERIASISELEGTDRVSVIVDDTPALLIQDKDSLYVVEDVCTHDGQPLTDGEIVDGSIECPRHGAQFDIATGAVRCMPATEPIHVFDVENRDGEIYARPRSEEAEQSPEAPAASSGSTTASAAPAEASESAPSATGSSNPFLQAPGEGDMLEALKAVIDPELFVNIVDLGLVYDITKAENDVTVTMTLTSPACPAGPQIVSQARSAIEKLPGVNTAEIKLTMSPPWTPEMMTDDARDQLGIF